MVLGGFDIRFSFIDFRLSCFSFCLSGSSFLFTLCCLFSCLSFQECLTIGLLRLSFSPQLKFKLFGFLSLLEFAFPRKLFRCLECSLSTSFLLNRSKSCRLLSSFAISSLLLESFFFSLSRLSLRIFLRHPSRNTRLLLCLEFCQSRGNSIINGLFGPSVFSCGCFGRCSLLLSFVVCFS